MALFLVCSLRSSVPLGLGLGHVLDSVNSDFESKLLYKQQVVYWFPRESSSLRLQIKGLVLSGAPTVFCCFIYSICEVQKTCLCIQKLHANGKNQPLQSSPTWKKGKLKLPFYLKSEFHTNYTERWLYNKNWTRELNNVWVIFVYDTTLIKR